MQSLLTLCHVTSRGQAWRCCAPGGRHVGWQSPCRGRAAAGSSRRTSCLLAAAQSDPAISRAHLEQIIEPANIACHARLKRAKQRGETRPDADGQVLIDLLDGGRNRFDGDARFGRTVL